jgi:hypothetical protein
MKTIHLLIPFLLPFTSLVGETTLIDAGRFIHLRDKEEETEHEDTYIRAEAIDAVVIHRSEREADKKLPFIVQLVTRMTTTRQKQSPEGWVSENRVYSIQCASRKEAEDVAAAILRTTGGDAKAKTAEQDGGGQPATRHESK